MNLIHNHIISSLNNWVDSTPAPQIVDSLTYDQYEINNPLRLNFYNPKNIDNRYLRTGANIAKNIGTEVVSAYINPFYLTHKVVNAPAVAYQTVINAYSKAQNS
jgi:hypothetical protein